MNVANLQDIAATNFWPAILPELMLGGTALLLLVLELLLPKKHHDLIPSISIAAQLGIAAALLMKFQTGIEAETFGSLIRHSTIGQCFRLFFLLTSILVSFLGGMALARQRLPRIEFFHIVLVISAAMMLLAQANHFVLLFVALETVTIGFYVLVSYYRHSPLSLEAGVKYLVLGALSSGILLFGIMLLYGAAGNPALTARAESPMAFADLHLFLRHNPDNLLASVGIGLVLCGVAFKIGVVPFQIWVPDVYQGAPTPVTAFLAVGSKAAGFAVLLTLTQFVFAPYQNVVIPILGLVAAATMIFGNLAALTQHNVKRLMGLSGVAHAGYLLLGVIAAYSEPLALRAIVFYLFAYLMAAMAVFGVMLHVSDANDANQEIEHYADLAKQQPFLGAVLAIGLGSLAGIPPLAGFMGKFLLFVAAFKAGLYALLAIAVVSVVISIYYYFGWIKAAFFTVWRVPLPEGEREPELPRTPVLPAAGITLGLLAFGSVFFGVYQGPIGAWLLR